MKFLINERVFKRWARKIEKGQDCTLDKPKLYPCFGYLVVQSYAYEEDQALYLYPDDVARMATQMQIGLIANQSAVANRNSP
jgi:hypothetical protein